MSYVCNIYFHSKMNKSERFDDNLQELARFAKVISHPARLAILKFLAETKSCISGDISDFLPLSRTTVSQHLKELRNLGLIHGEIDGLKVNYCLCTSSIEKYIGHFETFFTPIKSSEIKCEALVCSDQSITTDPKTEFESVYN
jgi:ArsR family transcriptional regulator, arsenate/arsenite/antimonite-responsive transcriptional repressor